MTDVDSGAATGREGIVKLRTFVLFADRTGFCAGTNVRTNDLLEDRSPTVRFPDRRCKRPSPPPN
ncbi:hypothetical protein EA473_01425 [Natrarchaeobius chitinivorans]|uniref:Uncharacterized protein n=1 Tax=Natrarchaeobius chitinivorans TaxID=1679083 RepID=A0A3N6MSY4_NATCH|nr:hypothetical protein EA473_01425 [Natrarchaeobius chitinivorans]